MKWINERTADKILLFNLAILTTCISIASLTGLIALIIHVIKGTL